MHQPQAETAFLTMRLDRAASLKLIHPLLRVGLLQAKPAISILMYHSISDDPELDVSPYYRLTTSPARFREQMQWLRDSGYAVTELTEALYRLNVGLLDSEPCVVLTFDDGFRDFMSHAWPVLAEFGFPATMFLPTAFISNRRAWFKGRECLTWAEIRELHNYGVSFGAHTVNHPTLYHLAWPEVRRELRDSRLQIESELEAPVGIFSYPYAFPQEDREFVKRLKQELIDQGYFATVTTVIGRVRPGSNPLCLKRLPVSESDDQPLFISKLAGAYDWMGGLQFLLRRAKRSAVLRSTWYTARHPHAT